MQDSLRPATLHSSAEIDGAAAQKGPGYGCAICSMAYVVALGTTHASAIAVSVFFSAESCARRILHNTHGYTGSPKVGVKLYAGLTCTDVAVAKLTYKPYRFCSRNGKANLYHAVFFSGNGKHHPFRKWPRFSQIAFLISRSAPAGFLSRLGVTADVGQYGMFCSAAHEACCKVGAEQQVQSPTFKNTSEAGC